MFSNDFYPYNYRGRSNFFSNVKRLKLSTFLDGTQKALNIINQAIPIIYQIKPIYQNAKTALKVVNAFKEETNIKERKRENMKATTISNNSPTYFL